MQRTSEVPCAHGLRYPASATGPKPIADRLARAQVHQGGEDPPVVLTSGRHVQFGEDMTDVRFCLDRLPDR